MRLSGLVIATILLVSAALLAQHSSGGGSSSGGSSHGGYSGGSSASSASSHTSIASASHIGSTSAASRQPSSFSKSPPANEKASPEKKNSRSFLHPFRKPQPVQSAGFNRPAPCLKGKCPVCPPGESRRGTGACGPPVVANNMCRPGQSWNGFACGTQYWVSDCRTLADQLAAQERQMRGQNNPGQSLRHQLLQNQYEQCLKRYSFQPFGYAFNDARLLDIP
jgi:hypothetical protein